MQTVILPTATQQVSIKPQTSGNKKRFNLSSIQNYIRYLSIKKHFFDPVCAIKMPNICFSKVSRLAFRRSLEWWGARFQSGSPAPSLGVCPSGRPPTAAVLYRSSSLRKRRGNVKKNCKFIIACFKSRKCAKAHDCSQYSPNRLCTCSSGTKKGGPERQASVWLNSYKTHCGYF